MKVNELIRKLQELSAKHGDLECEDSYGNSILEPEFNDDSDEGVIIVADKA